MKLLQWGPNQWVNPAQIVNVWISKDGVAYFDTTNQDEDEYTTIQSNYVESFLSYFNLPKP